VLAGEQLCALRARFCGLRSWKIRGLRLRPSPLWKDRSGRPPGTALSKTSPRLIGRLPSKTQDPVSGLEDPAHTSVVGAATWVKVSTAAHFAGSTPYCSWRSWGLRPRLYSFTCFAGWIRVCCAGQVHFCCAMNRCLLCRLKLRPGSLRSTFPSRLEPGVCVVIRSVPGRPALPAREASASAETHLHQHCEPRLLPQATRKT
jgi:hypothetical protein